MDLSDDYEATFLYYKNSRKKIFNEVSFKLNGGDPLSFRLFPRKQYPYSLLHSYFVFL